MGNMTNQVVHPAKKHLHTPIFNRLNYVEQLENTVFSTLIS